MNCDGDNISGLPGNSNVSVSLPKQECDETATMSVETDAAVINSHNPDDSGLTRAAPAETWLIPRHQGDVELPTVPDNVDDKTVQAYEQQHQYGAGPWTKTKQKRRRVKKRTNQTNVTNSNDVSVYAAGNCETVKRKASEADITTPVAYKKKATHTAMAMVRNAANRVMTLTVTFAHNPSVKLVAADADYLRSKLNDAVFDLTVEESDINVELFSFTNGRVRILGETQRTLDWVKSTVNGLPPRDGGEATFRAWTDDELPKYMKYTMYVPNHACGQLARFVSEIAKKYKLDNVWITLWRVASKPSGKTLVLGLSAEAVKRLSVHDMRPFIGMGRYELVKREEGDAESLSDDEDGEDDLEVDATPANVTE